MINIGNSSLVYLLEDEYYFYSIYLQYYDSPQNLISMKIIIIIIVKILIKVVDWCLFSIPWPNNQNSGFQFGLSFRGWVIIYFAVLFGISWVFIKGKFNFD